MTLPDPIRLARPDVGEAEVEAVAEVIRSGQLTMGPKVPEFERAIAAAVGTADAVAVSSATAALHLVLVALGVGPGDEVIVPAYTFPATANVVELCGARTVFADVDPRTFVLDIDAAAAAVTGRTKAVMAVHLFGYPVDWDKLRAAIPAHIRLVEDAAGALGAAYQGRRCGSLGVAGCLSFHPRKLVTTGEGGAVTTDDPALAQAVREGRYFGMQMRDTVDLQVPGTNYKLADVLCAIGIPQLARMQELLGARERVAAWYAERLPESVDVPAAAEGDRHGWQAYVIGIDRRDEVRAALADEGIESQIGTYAVHRLSAYAGRGSFPGADRAFERALALPFSTTTTEAEVDRVCAALRSLTRA